MISEIKLPEAPISLKMMLDLEFSKGISFYRFCKSLKTTLNICSG